MSTESIVNRVSQNFVQDELKKLGPSESQLNVWDTPEGEKVLDRIVEQAAAELGAAVPPTVDEQPVYDVLTGQTKSREEFDKGPAYSLAKPDADKFANQTNFNGTLEREDPADSIGNTASVLNTLIVSRVEFDKFRAQVIMALKHNGIDTRRFFPE